MRRRLLVAWIWCRGPLCALVLLAVAVSMAVVFAAGLVAVSDAAATPSPLPT